jgi:adenylate cyclase class 2
MGTGLEREIKLRFDSADEARACVRATGATPLRGRRLQEDALFDTDSEQLRRARSALRVRTESGHSLLTFKGPVQPGPMKVREEHETVIGDASVVQSILAQLGLHVWFRYQKVREEFAAADIVVAIDETPVGTFVELEGGEDAIRRMAEALGRGPSDYLLDSYRTLFVKAREAGTIAGPHMLFTRVPDA